MARASQLPSQIPVEFALPFALKLSCTLALFLQLVQRLFLLIGLVAPKRLPEPVTDGLRPHIVDRFICYQIVPCDPL